MLSSVASKKGGLAENVTSVCLAPIILDTPNNRKFMPKADFRFVNIFSKSYQTRPIFSTWTPLDWVAQNFQEWTENVEGRPKNGSTLKLVTKNNETEMIQL